MRKSILIVDDSPSILAVARHALVEAGYNVSTHVGALDIDPLGYDLILMDVDMPDGSGEEIAATLRAYGAITAPVYLFSMLPDEELRRRAEAARLDGFIAKTEGTAHLVAEVDRILGRSQAA